jgi:cysteinyl-tRNA synthetase
VKHVRNLTDVDDHTIGQALAEKRPLSEITTKWAGIFHADCAALNCLAPHAEPAATHFIREQVDMIEVLMRKGNAYRAPDGSVYFRIGTFPGYGALSRIKERTLKATNSVFDADQKDDVGDFAVWKAYKPEEDGDVRWPGPEGAAEGRPGWHIECSAMIRKLLGETIDLHSGGIDLLFPHHENEIAQSQCCNGTTFARHWYHSEHLLVDGAKMSKSKGNYYTLGDLTAKGHSAMAVRYALLTGHPRKQLNFTLDSLHAAESALQTLRGFDGAMKGLLESTQRGPAAPSAIFDDVLAALRYDINTPAALGALFIAINSFDVRRATRSDALAFEVVKQALGFDMKRDAKGAIPEEIRAIADRRWNAKLGKDFATADRLRVELAAAGWSMQDGKSDFTLEPAKKA